MVSLIVMLFHQASKQLLCKFVRSNVKSNCSETNPNTPTNAKSLKVITEWHRGFEYLLVLPFPLIFIFYISYFPMALKFRWGPDMQDPISIYTLPLSGLRLSSRPFWNIGESFEIFLMSWWYNGIDRRQSRHFTGMVFMEMRNICWSSLKIKQLNFSRFSHSITKLGKYGGAIRRLYTSSQFTCLKNGCFLISFASFFDDPNRLFGSLVIS